MAIRRASKSSISTTSSGKRFNLIAGYSPAVDEMDLIERVTVGVGGAATIAFSSIPQTYQHLQLRWLARSTRSATSDSILVRFNDLTTSHWQYHSIYGDGSTTGGLNSAGPGNNCYIGSSSGATSSANTRGSGVTDILDYTVSKNKTLRFLCGLEQNGSGAVEIGSALFQNTAAITKILVYMSNGNIAESSTFSLYGVVA